MYCPSCGLRQPDLHRFCVSCGSHLPSELLRSGPSPKVTQLFAGIPTHPSDPPDPILRVSRYADDVTFEASEGSVVIPGRHVRLSVWVGERPECAISLSDDEATRLAAFIRGPIDVELADIGAS
jgi:hypothetical protein